MADSIDRLYDAVLQARASDPSFSRTAKLFRGGVEKMAKKLGEEAIEVGIGALSRARSARSSRNRPTCSTSSACSGPNAA